MNPVYEKMGQDSEKIVCRHFGDLLEFQTQYFLSISSEIKRILNRYTQEVTRGGKITSRSFLLYESISTSTQIFDLIEKTLW